MDLHLYGRVALVTGAGRGVGRGVALRLAEEGARVIVNDFHAHRAERVAEEIEKNGGRALPGPADITDRDQVLSLVAEASSSLGPVDILVNNAGIPAYRQDETVVTGWGEFHVSDPASWTKMIDLNIYGTMNCTHAVLAGMIERRYGKIVSVMSEAGRLGEARLAAYSAAKAGILGFSKAIAREVGKHRVNVNVVALGAVDAAEVPYSELDDRARERLDRLLRSYPIGRGHQRISRAADVANAIAYLVSDRSEFVTGQVLGVSGGFAMP